MILRQILKELTLIRKELQAIGGSREFEIPITIDGEELTKKIISFRDNRY